MERRPKAACAPPHHALRAWAGGESDFILAARMRASS